MCICVLSASRHVCEGHTGNEGARSRNAVRFPHRHLDAQKASGYTEARVSAVIYHGAKSGIALLEESAFILAHLRLYPAYPDEEILTGNQWSLYAACTGENK